MAAVHHSPTPPNTGHPRDPSAPGPARTALSATVLPARTARSRGAHDKNPRRETRISGCSARTPAGPVPVPVPGSARPARRPDPASPAPPRPVPSRPVPSRPVPPPRGCGTAAPWGSPRQALPARGPSVTSCRRLRAGAVPAPRRPRGAQQPKAPARANPPSSHCPAAAMTGRGGGAAGGGRDPAEPPPLGSAPAAAPARFAPPRPLWFPRAAPGHSRRQQLGRLRTPPVAPGAVLARLAGAWSDAAGPGASREPWPGVPADPQGGSQPEPRSGRGPMSLSP
ncbi:uncharacterized protein [Chamaea fasciata]|uniref:uncharacterized protein n=1 Tax=Chamaea fasciata TaxID=190680 RepID=UPI00336A29F1